MIEISSLRKIFAMRDEETLALDGVSLSIVEGEFFAVLGPSGCGKSTLLRCIAGLEHPDSGQIDIAGRRMVGVDGFVPPEKRGLGMVFQSYAIWPHMTVGENVAYPLTVGRGFRSGRGKYVSSRVRESLEMVGLGHLHDRQATDISGGQQQRVALARAFVANPSVILLDEPLSNLDAALRREMRFDIRELQQRLGVTVVYVTHDQDEALVMADRVAIMELGQVMEIGVPSEVYDVPRTLFGACFLGEMNVFDGFEVAELAESCTVLRKDGAELALAFTADAVRVGTTATFCVRSEDVRIISADGAGESNHGSTWDVVGTMFFGTHVEVLLRHESADSEITVHCRREEAPSNGSEVKLDFSGARVLAYALDGTLIGSVDSSSPNAAHG